MIDLSKEEKELLVQTIQLTVAQMKIDDYENNPDSAKEEFQCPCCGDFKELSGSMIYENELFCNDCTLLTEISLALQKIKNPLEMIDAMEDKRFENLYKSMFNQDEQSENV